MTASCESEGLGEHGKGKVGGKGKARGRNRVKDRGRSTFSFFFGSVESPRIPLFIVIDLYYH